MIQPLRKLHRRAMLLWAALPALYVAALTMREAPPRANDGFTWPDREPADLRWRAESRHEIERAAIRFRRIVDLTHVSIAPEPGFASPGVLVYWSRGVESRNDLPPDATLLGTLSAGRGVYRLPASEGSVLLYSLGHQKLLARVALKDLP